MCGQLQWRCDAHHRVPIRQHPAAGSTPSDRYAQRQTQTQTKSRLLLLDRGRCTGRHRSKVEVTTVLVKRRGDGGAHSIVGQTRVRHTPRGGGVE